MRDDQRDDAALPVAAQAVADDEAEDGQEQSEMSTSSIDCRRLAAICW